MGFACPVCDLPQADGEHLANHLAFTAMLHGDEHAAWLDDAVPEWAELSSQELSMAVVQYADETEYTDVFKDTTGGNPGPGRTPSGDEHGHPHGHEHDHDHSHEQADGAEGPMPDLDAARDRATTRGPTDAETRRILEEARQLTEAMRSQDTDEASDDEQDRED